jgi:hypothetical protein
MSILIDFNNIIKTNNLEVLLKKVQPVPITPYKIGLILIIDKKTLHILESKQLGEERITYINSEGFVGSIKGYSYFIYDNDSKKCKLGRVSGNGINVNKHILTSMNSNLPNDVIIWTCIDLDNDKLNQMIKSYTDIGFRDPYINIKKDKTYELSMSKQNNLERYENAYNDAVYVLQQFKNKNTHHCGLFMRFSETTISYLQKLSHVGHTVNTNGTVSQKELTGSFKFIRADDRLIHTISIEEDSIVAGDEEGVPIIKSMYSFHSHPKEAYERHKVDYGWPSHIDFNGFLKSVDHYGMLFHIIVSLEGVYVLSLGEYWINNISGVSKDIDKDIKKMFTIRYKKGDTIQENFLDIVNNIVYDGKQFKKNNSGSDYGPLFKVCFIPWKYIGNVFHISYAREDGLNCLIKKDIKL